MSSCQQPDHDFGRFAAGTDSNRILHSFDSSHCKGLEDGLQEQFSFTDEHGIFALDKMSFHDLENLRTRMELQMREAALQRKYTLAATIQSQVRMSHTCVE